MAVCTFFGHRDCPSSVLPALKETMIYLIEHQSVNLFYVGNHGMFDHMVRSLLRSLSMEYPYIRYRVVLAYFPTSNGCAPADDYSDTMLPEGIEIVPKRFAISWRNKWMIEQSDYVVTYVTHSWDGAAQYAELAARRHKTVIPIAQSYQ